MRWHLALRAVAAAGIVAGCGGTSAQQPRSGQALFRQDCSACHSLVGNESQHKQGGDLLGYQFGRAVLRQLASEMPVRPPLTSSQLTTIVDYVYRAEQLAGKA